MSPWIVLIAIVLPTLIAWAIGSSRDRALSGFVLGLLLSWIGVLIVLFLRAPGAPCPACLERVKPQAQLCRHCGTQLEWPEVDPWSNDRPVVANARPAVQPRPLQHRPAAAAGSVNRDDV